MNLKKDARIYSPSGEEIGRLTRFVLDPKTKEISNIVFEKGGLLDQDEYLLIFDWVERVTDEGIYLRFLPEDPDEILPYQENDYIITDEASLNTQGDVNDQFLPSYYYYPPAPYGASGFMRPNEMYTNQPTSHPGAEGHPSVPRGGVDEPVIRKTETNIPDHTVGLKEGAKVLSLDSKHIGDVEQVILDKNSRKATHFVITKGLLLKQSKLVPAEWVSEMLEDQVILAVEEKFLQRLPDYEPR